MADSIMQTEREEWRDIPGYEGLYQVSDMGRVRSLPRIVEFNGIRRRTQGKTLKPHDNGNGYMNVPLHKNGTTETAYVHRLVACAFVPNPDDKPCVNHIDYDTNNNRASNLEWVTQGENIAHSLQNSHVPHKSWKMPTSGERYIYEIERRGRKVYRVQIRRNRRFILNREFRDVESAVKCRDEFLGRGGANAEV